MTFILTLSSWSQLQHVQLQFLNQHLHRLQVHFVFVSLQDDQQCRIVLTGHDPAGGGVRVSQAGLPLSRGQDAADVL